MNALKVKRGKRGFVLKVDVPGEFADNARVYETRDRARLALAIANACTLDAWLVQSVTVRDGYGGFTAYLVLAE